MNNLYDFEEENNIANVCANKAFETAAGQGAFSAEAQKIAKSTFDNVRRSRAERFLKDLNEKLGQLSNADVVNLLLALIADGLIIEDDEDLEYWISRLEILIVNRISEYMNFSLAMNRASGKELNQFMSIFKQIPISEFENMEKMAQIMQFLHMKKSPLDDKSPAYAKWKQSAEQFSQIEKMIKRDLNRRKNSHDVPNNNNRQHDSLSQLKAKMQSAGVAEGGNYWNDVIAAYNMSGDKESFVSQWTADYERISQENESKNTVENTRSIEKENEKIAQNESLQKQMEKQEQNDYLSTEFTNEANQRAAMAITERYGIKIDKDNIARVKMVVKSGKEM